MASLYHLDYETRSAADIKAVGAFRYAEDPSTEIVCAAIARDDEQPLLWVNPKFEFDDMYECRSSPGVEELLKEMNESNAPVYAHNSPFEHSITNHCPNNHWFRIGINRWRCTAAMARRAAIPASLEKAAETLGLAEQKDRRGKSLITKFSIPKTDGTFTQPIERQADFIDFCNYCLQDVRVEQGIHQALKHFEMTGDVLAAFQADMAINSRGLPVNVDALMHAQKLIDAKEEELSQRFRELTGFSHGQNKVYLDWLREHGYQGDNLQAGTIDEQLEGAVSDIPEVGESLRLKQALSFAAVKKIKAMIRCASDDNRVRGSLQFYGAATGRWSGKLIQPQNFKKTPKEGWTHQMYADLRNKCSTSHIELFYGGLLESLSYCIRHFIHDPEVELFDVDFSAIEARINAWLANEEWKLEVFRTHGKIYEATICRMTGMPLEEMLDYKKRTGKHHPDRFKGKVSELALGYQGGEGALVKMGAIDMGLKEEELDGIKESWREANPNIVAMWHAYEATAKKVIQQPGLRVSVNRVEMFCAKTAGSPYLFIKLPSGRRLAYRNPQVHNKQVKDKKGKPVFEDEEKTRPKMKPSIRYWGPLEGKATYGWVDLYGGKITENVCQAVAADLMASGTVNAEKAGIEVATLIHDQCLAYKRGNHTLQELCDCLTDLPSWAEGLPFAVDGSVQPYYTKED